jgi:hypothetical protein
MVFKKSDETDFLKKSSHSAGVKRQCSGTAAAHRDRFKQNPLRQHAHSTWEEIFSELAVKQDIGSISGQIADIIQA